MFNKNNHHPYNLHHLPQQGSHHHFHSGDEILFHHHHHHHDADILSGHYFPSAANAPAVDAAAAFYHDPSATALDPSFSVVPKTTKKDRHSKIYTSSGPRDRRVRLSIGVARRFFDLQEILGFDKPSKTLDWLLTNSTTAIKDLMQTKENLVVVENAPVSPSSPSDCEADSAEFFSKRKLGDRKQDLAKESRAKARARARERTREKMCIKQLQDDFNSCNIPIQHMNEFCRISGSSSSNNNNNRNSDSIFYSPADHHQDLIQQEAAAIVIKRKVKHFISSNSNYGAPEPNYNTPTENWDICAILDSHKFINSTSEN